MEMMDKYFDIVKSQLCEIQNDEVENIDKASDIMSETLQNDGLIYVFGSGHSQMFSLEMFYRAGGLVPVNPMLQASVAMYTGTITSEYERLENIGDKIFDKSGMTSKDTLIIVSHSGRNSMPIDLAIAAKKAGVKIITIVSKNFMEGITSRHKSGKFVKDFADVIIDNHCMLGDATIQIDGMKSKVAGTSSILSISILESLVAETVKKCVDNGYYPPVWVSGNVDEGDKMNRENYLKYRNRVCYL